MPDSEREYKILNYLKTNKQAAVDELAKMLFVSTASIRRDLDRMQKTGLVKRTHGGALYIEKADEISVAMRKMENAAYKEKTVDLALNHIPDFKTVFIDNSSTCLMLAERMNLAYKTVVTNGLQLALLLSKRNDVNVFLAGGTLTGNPGTLVGSATIESLSKFRFDLTLTSCAAVDAEGTYENSSDTAILKRVAIRHAKKNILLFDSMKLTRTAPYSTVPLDRFDAIFTDLPDEIPTLTNRDPIVE